MNHAGLNWNEKKCKFGIMIKGKTINSQEKIELSHNFTMEMLKENEKYKFLGVPEDTSHDTKGLLKEL